MTIRNEPTEGDLLLAELAARGRNAFLGEEGGMTFLIMAADPDAPHDEDAAYGEPHILMYAGERADRPAADHRDLWSAHLHVADGTSSPPSSTVPPRRSTRPPTPPGAPER
ncbi:MULTISPECIES: hypothetical protein [unclassified Streptomyces]|uniref:hypothetical protein n=1 Tax=unclassified Streptomyces TaxID=2593676 RepID=UPI00344BD2A7